MSSADKNPNNVMGGLKATINNPKVSDEAKDSARERLNDMVNSGAGTTTETTPDLNDNHVIGGYKATLNNDRVSEEAKAHAREILDAAGVLEEFEEGGSQEQRDEHENRVLGGYKAALNNPNVSEAAKEHAREFLRERNAL
ncbi:hypothetical protein VKT23_008611 [Stygiomarasmius scandens]|uniref:Conidiation-specific protein 6 n=1 Tax=Marasmiellus scandens TaxID=2682957 RepID=A0ABR1JJQ5_9AGAR